MRENGDLDGWAEPRLPETRLTSPMSPLDRTLDVEDDNVLPRDIVQIVDPYPGQTLYLDFTTADLAHVLSVRERGIDIAPLDGSSLRAHPVWARVRVVSRAVFHDPAFGPVPVKGGY